MYILVFAGHDKYVYICVYIYSENLRCNDALFLLVCCIIKCKKKIWVIDFLYILVELFIELHNV